MLSNHFAIAFGLVAPIAADYDTALVAENLIEQARQCRCIAGTTVCHFDVPDLLRACVIAKLAPALLATVVSPMLFVFSCLPRAV